MLTEGVGMARSDTDSWDLASSVGATATMVAAARALASEDTEPIINDPFAAPLVRAVGIDFFTRVVDGDIDPAETGNSGTTEPVESSTLPNRTVTKRVLPLLLSIPNAWQ